MKKKFVYFQPEYVSNFQCDGQACKAHCCKYWRIDIDKDTYKKYAAIKPKSKAQSITEHLKKDKFSDRYLVKLNEKSSCPFLTEDNWCSIQRTYGADYLSNVCMTYPRVTYNLGEFYERSLMLTCPVAADFILKQSEPMVFEQLEVSAKEYMDTCRDMVRVSKLPQKLLRYIISVQYAVISLLQERRLTLDQRLIVIGYFFDQLEEIVNDDRLDEIETLSMIYTSEDFFNEQIKNIISSIDFDVRNYIKIMFEIFGMLYGDKAKIKADAQGYLDFVVQTLEIKLDKNGTASVTELAQSYLKHSKIREKFLQENSIIFENYLVQEFFSCLYPWRIEGPISLNYGVFLVTYKILELIAVSMAVADAEISDKFGKKEMTNEHIIGLIRWFVQRIDHGSDYINSIKNCLQDKDNTIKILRDLLQG